jgi:predicted RNA-binding Zn-ribbon protein involved in translation (DUF1610 family)
MKPMKHQTYNERARQLLLPPMEASAFVALSEYADTTGHCPSCGESISRHEAERMTHVRTCEQLRTDANM